jgi:hypothetical protein
VQPALLKTIVCAPNCALYLRQAINYLRQMNRRQEV